jgi:hypothetical protein
MLICKVIEIAFEAAPGAALQAAVALGSSWSGAAVASVGISCISTGFTTAMMAFDMDTKPANRHHSPEFYGAIPDDASKRLVIFVELFTLHTTHDAQDVRNRDACSNELALASSVYGLGLLCVYHVQDCKGRPYILCARCVCHATYNMAPAMQHKTRGTFVAVFNVVSFTVQTHELA